jgi:hypothetical protein
VEPVGTEATVDVHAARPLSAAVPHPLASSFAGRPTRVVVTAAVLVLALAGVAAAYWSAIGSGSGSATLASSSLRVEQATAGETGLWLFPGSVGDLVVSVTNQGDTPIRVHDLVVGTPVAEPADCPADAVTTFLGRTEHEALGAFLDGLEPLSPGETRAIAVPGSVAMVLSAPDVCQGALFTFPVLVEGRS